MVGIFGTPPWRRPRTKRPAPPQAQAADVRELTPEERYAREIDEMVYAEFAARWDAGRRGARNPTKTESEYEPHRW
jgi:hypothetical protein